MENKEEMGAIEDRLQKAVDYVLESHSTLRSGERKLMRNKLTQLTSCLTLKVARNALHCPCPHCPPKLRPPTVPLDPLCAWLTFC